MSLVDQYRDIINELDDISSGFLDLDFKDIIDYSDQDMDAPDNKVSLFMEELKQIHAPLADGTIDPGDIETIIDNMMNHYGDQMIARAQKMAKLQQQLCPLYEQLQKASHQEWQDYVRYVEHTRLEKLAPMLINLNK